MDGLKSFNCDGRVGHRRRRRRSDRPPKGLSTCGRDVWLASKGPLGRCSLFVKNGLEALGRHFLGGNNSKIVRRRRYSLWAKEMTTLGRHSQSAPNRRERPRTRSNAPARCGGVRR
jgi:hypothetical protein